MKNLKLFDLLLVDLKKKMDTMERNKKRGWGEKREPRNPRPTERSKWGVVR